MTSFKDFALHDRIQQAVSELGYETPTPIQEQSIPALLEGRDLLGIAQTGTGKTAAFALPSLNLHLSNPQPRVPKSVRVLVIAPTRELVLQIADNYKAYSKRMNCLIQTVFGGSPIQRQIGALRKGCDILVSTPGRLIDLMDRRAVTLDFLDIIILDEADQMFDMGFIHDLRKIMQAAPEERQNLLFSATMPKQIAAMADEYLKDPVRVSVAPESTTAERVQQGLVHIARENKNAMLDEVLASPTAERVVVFTRTKHCADRVARHLDNTGHKVQAIHGGRSQSQRIKALNIFKTGKADILVATDVAARGIDVKGITHVVNYEMPNIAEQYVHRIGRTARAGTEGIAISFVDRDELYYLREIERNTKIKIDEIEVTEDLEDLILPTPDEKTKIVKPDLRGGGRGRSGASRGGRPQGRGGDRRDSARRNERGGDRRPKRRDDNRNDGQTRSDRSSEDRRPRRSFEERGDNRADRRPRGENSERSGRKPWGDRPKREDTSERNERPARRPRSEHTERNDRADRKPRRAEGERSERRPRSEGQEKRMRSEDNVRRPSGDIPRRPRRKDGDRPESRSDKPFEKRGPRREGDDNRSEGKRDFKPRRPRAQSGDAPPKRREGGKPFSKKPSNFKGKPSRPKRRENA